MGGGIIYNLQETTVGKSSRGRPLGLPFLYRSVEITPSAASRWIELGSEYQLASTERCNTLLYKPMQAIGDVVSKE